MRLGPIEKRILSRLVSGEFVPPGVYRDYTRTQTANNRAVNRLVNKKKLAVFRWQTLTEEQRKCVSVLFKPGRETSEYNGALSLTKKGEEIISSYGLTEKNYESLPFFTSQEAPPSNEDALHIYAHDLAILQQIPENPSYKYLCAARDEVLRFFYLSSTLPGVPQEELTFFLTQGFDKLFAVLRLMQDMPSGGQPRPDLPGVPQEEPDYSDYAPPSDNTKIPLTLEILEEERSCESALLHPLPEDPSYELLDAALDNVLDFLYHSFAQRDDTRDRILDALAQGYDKVLEIGLFMQAVEHESFGEPPPDFS